jgi:hypothetical protein
MFFFSLNYQANNFILNPSENITYHPQVKSINLLSFKKFFISTFYESDSEKELVFSGTRAVSSIYMSIILKYLY